MAAELASGSEGASRDEICGLGLLWVLPMESQAPLRYKAYAGAPAGTPHPMKQSGRHADANRLSIRAAAPRRLPVVQLVVAAVLMTSLLTLAAGAQDQPAPVRKDVLPKRVYQVTRLAGPPPKIDGKLDDPCWATQGEWQDHFTQREPHEGQPGSQPTQFKILYDDQYLYVAIRAFDSELAKQPRLRGKRDEFTGDIVGVNFDSYFDKRTGFEFDITSGGAKIDLILRNDGIDLDWNAVWDGKVGVEKDAWTAELRIPFSQLRYGSQKEQVWGLHCWRWINRYQEESDWQLLPMDSPGFVYSFGELHGIRDLPPSRRIELLPYVLIKYATSAPQEGNPYRADAKTNFEGGLDAKIGLASNLTADLTVNPDFGQVEADPSQINLTTYETFLAEKRPFFLEGRNIFDYGIGDDVMFYSRRIGQAPTFDAPADGFTDAPTSTRILGAAKLTGKTPDGLSIGVIQGFTDRAAADVTENGVERQQAVAPLTSYTVARVQQDIDKGNSVIGGIFTATARSIHDDAIDYLPEHAYTGGLDLLQYWGDRTYYLKLQGIASRVDGSPDAIRSLMLDSVHNYQRPDASYLGIEDGATHLDGTGGNVQVGKDNNGRWRYYVGADWRSPGLELNDLGYLRTADLLEHDAQLEYYDTSLGRLLRKTDVRLKEIGKYDFGGEFLGQELITVKELSEKLGVKGQSGHQEAGRQEDLRHHQPDAGREDWPKIWRASSALPPTRSATKKKPRRISSRPKTRRIASTRASRGHHHGPRRSRQNLSARCHPRRQRRRPRSRRHHPAHRRLSRRKERPEDRLHRYARPRSVHPHARPRRQGHRYRGSGGRRRRRRHAANARSHRSRQSGQGADHRRHQQDRQARRPAGTHQTAARRSRPAGRRLGRRRRHGAGLGASQRRISICCSK